MKSKYTPYQDEEEVVKEKIPSKLIKQVEYLGRWVPFENFRAFVYGANGEQKLANNYFEYQALVATGLWFSIPEEVPKPRIIDSTTVAVVEEKLAIEAPKLAVEAPKVTEVAEPMAVIEPEIKEPREVEILEEKQVPKPVKGVVKDGSNR